MKTIKILTFVIVGILVVGLGLGAYVYFCTDTFKTNKEIFYKYTTEEQMAKMIDFDLIEQTLTMLQSENSELNIDVNINASNEGQNLLNNNTILLKSKNNPGDNKAEFLLTFGNVNKNDILEIDGVYNKEKLGISFKDITNKYIALKNENLNEFWKKLGINDLDINEIELFNNKDIEEKLEELNIDDWTEFFTKIAEQATKENYSNLGKAQIEFAGENVEAKVYELKLSKEELKQIYDLNSNTNEIAQFLNGEYDFSQIIYIYEEKLAKIEIIMKNQNSSSIQITKTFEEQNDNLLIQIDTDNEIQMLIEITKTQVNENNKYLISLEIISSYAEILAEINIDIKFNTNNVITELTDANSVVINDMSTEEITKIAETVISMAKEKEEIENTVIGVIYNLIESISLLDSTRTSTEQAIE